MSNLIDYLEKVKDLPFDQEPLNILDKVCINEIGYLTYEKWLSASDLKETINFPAMSSLNYWMFSRMLHGGIFLKAVNLNKLRINKILKRFVTFT